MQRHTGSATDHIPSNAKAKNNFACREILSPQGDSELCHLLQEMLLAANDLLAPRGHAGMRRAPKSPAGNNNTTTISPKTSTIQIQPRTASIHIQKKQSALKAWEGPTPTPHE